MQLQGAQKPLLLDDNKSYNMSTRFSQWRNTEYVGLPVESYLQSGLIQDQRIDTELQKTSAALAEYKSLQAVGANAKAYQSQIMSEIKAQMEDLAKQSLKSPEALMKIQQVVSNPTYIQGLKQIAKNTEYFKAAQKAALDYEKESGNKINAAPFYKAYQEMMNETGDPTKFNANRFAGLDSVPKYIEIQKEVNETISKMKPGTKVWDYKKGIYDYVRSEEELSPERILNAVKHEFNNRVDLQTQLQRNIDFESYNLGVSADIRGNQLKETYGKTYNNLTAELESYKTNPAAFKKKYGIQNDEQLKSTVAQLEDQINEYSGLLKMDPRSILTQNAIAKSAIVSGSLYAYKKESLKKTVNPIDVVNAQAAARQKQIDKLDKIAKGSTAMIDMALTFGQDAAVQENKIKDGSYLRELAGSINMDIKKFNIAGGPVRQYKGAVADVAGGQGFIDLIRGTTEADKKQKQELVSQLAEKYGFKKGVS